MQFKEPSSTKTSKLTKSDQHCKERKNGVIEIKTFQRPFIANIAEDTICIKNKQQQKGKTPQEKNEIHSKKNATP